MMKDGRPTQSINSTFADAFDSTRLQRQTIDSIDRLDRFRGLLGLGLRFSRIRVS